MKHCYTKILSRNDTGQTGGHQAGIAVPKGDTRLLEFLPQLNLSEFNPDTWILCRDPDGEMWRLRYIYYNGKTFNPPKSTRNEYRLTHTNGFMRKYNAKAEDELVMQGPSPDGHYEIEIRKHSAGSANESNRISGGKIVLRGWNRVY